MQPDQIVSFWTRAGPSLWFAKSDAFDAALRSQFEASHHAAARGEYAAWEGNPEGALALLILLDQIPRNIYRGSAHAFATDPLARNVATVAVARRFDRGVDGALRPFFYLPFEHSEALEDQDRALAAFTEAANETGDQDSLKWAIQHRDIIVRFGRFPHRNAALGRPTTPVEAAFLASGGFAG